MPAGQHVVEPAGPDVVRPAVAADDPHASADEVVEHAAQVVDRRPVEPVEAPLELRDPLALRPQLGLAQLRRLEDLVHELGAHRVAQLGEAAAGQLGVAVGGEPQPEAELGVVLEQRVRPRRPAPVGVDRPRRGRQVAAVDRRAAGRVGDGQPVAEQLREQLQVRGLAAAGAGAGELEQRLEELRAAHGAEVDPRAVAARQLLEERDVLALGVQPRLARVEVDRLAHRVPARRHRARLDAQPASRCSPRRTPAACSGVSGRPGALSGAERKPAGAPSSSDGS